MDSNTTVLNIGIGLTVIGFILLVGYALYNLFNIDYSGILKMSIVTIVAGIILVLLILIKEKMGLKDKEIERKY